MKDDKSVKSNLNARMFEIDASNFPNRRGLERTGHARETTSFQMHSPSPLLQPLTLIPADAMEFHLAQRNSIGMAFYFNPIRRGGGRRGARSPGRKTEIDHFPCRRVSGGDTEKSPSDCFSSETAGISIRAIGSVLARGYGGRVKVAVE